MHLEIRKALFLSCIIYGDINSYDNSYHKFNTVEQRTRIRTTDFFIQFLNRSGIKFLPRLL
jgi:hypothetical protein